MKFQLTKIDKKYVKLIDTIPPSVEIINPENLDIFENEIVTISGRASDNYMLDKVEIIIDENIPIVLDGKEEWFYSLDIKNLDSGEHLIQVRVYDNFGLTGCKDITIVRNDSDMDWHPTIDSLFITPENPTNTSNIFVYSNVTSDSPFSIKKVILCHDNGTGPIRHEMSRYGDFPSQERHIEDDIQNIPNDPIYGFELGNFQTGELISYWIETFDTANNKGTSSMITFIIG